MERRNLAVVALFTLACFAPFWDKAYHIDEPFFLAIAKHILQDPRHPLAFDFNWYGSSVPMSRINNTPPLFPYLLALALKASGGGEALTRLLLLPLDLASALGLYLLAGRFLKKPLLPVLILIAGPAYLINMNHLMPEKLVGALAFPCLYALVRGADERRWGWYWASSALCAAALLAKYNAVFLLAPALVYAWRRGVDGRRLAGYAAVAVSGLSLYLLADLSRGGPAFGAALHAAALSAASPASAWSHRLRSFLSFTGGLGLVTLAWPLWLRRDKWIVLLCCMASSLLFLQVFDLEATVRPVDRLTGFFLSWGTLYCLWAFCRGPRGRGWGLWAAWALGAAVLQVVFYWSIMARFILFLLPPLVLGLAEALEEKLSGTRLERLYLASLAGVLAVSLALARVDYGYAEVQRDFARQAGLENRGGRLWGTGQWGLQYYLQEAGAGMLDESRGGWAALRPGDVVVVPRVNGSVVRPRAPLRAEVVRVTVPGPLPVRLITVWAAEGGFYSSFLGFLPYSLTREPLEEFEVVKVL